MIDNAMWADLEADVLNETSSLESNQYLFAQSTISPFVDFKNPFLEFLVDGFLEFGGSYLGNA